MIKAVELQVLGEVDELRGVEHVNIHVRVVQKAQHSLEGGRGDATVLAIQGD